MVAGGGACAVSRRLHEGEGPPRISNLTQRGAARQKGKSNEIRAKGAWAAYLVTPLCMCFPQHAIVERPRTNLNHNDQQTDADGGFFTLNRFARALVLSTCVAKWTSWRKPRLENMETSAVMNSTFGALGSGQAHLSTLANLARSVLSDYGASTTQDVATLSTLGNNGHSDQNTERDFQRWLGNLYNHCIDVLYIPLLLMRCDGPGLVEDNDSLAVALSRDGPQV